MATATVRSASSEASSVLEHVAGAKRCTVTTGEDRAWLASITPHYRKLLERMADRRSLYRVVPGKYVVAPRGTNRVDEAAPVELLVDLLLRSYGPYYLGFLSAFIAHRLTDLHSAVVTAAVPQDCPLDRATIPMAGYELRLVRLAPSRWPQGGDDVERIRVKTGTKEFVWRSTVERTLVDGLLRPDLCGGIETVVTGWARAAMTDSTSWDRVWQIARANGTSTAKRAAYLLLQLDQEAVVNDDLPALRRNRTRVPLDRYDSYGLPAEAITRDPRTGVMLNVPEAHVSGWVAGAGLG